MKRLNQKYPQLLSDLSDLVDIYQGKQWYQIGQVLTNIYNIRFQSTQQLKNWWISYQDQLNYDNIKVYHKMILLELAAQHNLTVSNIIEQWFFRKLPCLSEKKIVLLLTQLMNEFMEDLIDTRGYKKQAMKMKARKFQFYILQYFIQSGTALSDEFRSLMLIQADLLLDDRSTKFFRYVQLVTKSKFQKIFDEIIYLHDLEDRKNNLQGDEKSQYKQIFKTEYLEMMLKQNQEAVLYSDHSQFVYQIGEKPKPTNQQIQKKQIQTKNGKLIVRKSKVLFPAHDVLQFREELEEESELEEDIINAFSDMVAKSKQSE